LEKSIRYQVAAPSNYCGKVLDFDGWFSVTHYLVQATRPLSGAAAETQTGIALRDLHSLTYASVRILNTCDLYNAVIKHEHVQYTLNSRDREMFEKNGIRLKFSVNLFSGCHQSTGDH